MEIAVMIFQYAVLGAIGGVCLAIWGLIKQYNLEKWVSWAVMAWEMYVAQKGRGESKKQQVLEFLAEKFPKVDLMELDVLVEKAVLELNKDKNIGSCPFRDLFEEIFCRGSQR